MYYHVFMSKREEASCLIINNTNNIKLYVSECAFFLLLE